MKSDIQNRKDIEQLVDAFYAGATKDPLIGHFFTTIIPIDWQSHLPVMCSFWENALFHTGGYSGSMMGKHQEVHRLLPMRAEHFQRWTEIFCRCTNDLFEGEKADQAKQHALNMALMLQIKIGIQ